jgi:hypothetical protein
MKHLRMMWRWWAKSLGQKASDCDKEADKVAVIRSFIFATYLITNAFIVAGVVRHWNDRDINVQVEIYENPNSSEIIHAERRNYLGVDGNARVEGIYRTGTIKNRTGEFE